MSNLANYHDDLIDALFNPNTLALRNLVPWEATMVPRLNVNVEETDTAHIVTAHVPGISRDNIDIDFANDFLTIEIKNESDNTEKEHNFTRREIRSFSAKRSLPFENVDTANISASLADGVLTINLPKAAPEKPESTKIEIQ